MAEPRQIEDENYIPTEPGIEEESGFFDVLKPYKNLLLDKIRGESVNPSETRQLLAEVADWMTPDSPTMLFDKMQKLSPKLQQMVKTVKFPGVKAEDTSKVFSYGKTATKKSFEEAPEAIKEIKRSEALKTLGIKAPPSPPKASPPVPPTLKKTPVTKQPPKQTGVDELADEFEVLP